MLKLGSGITVTGETGGGVTLKAGNPQYQALEFVNAANSVVRDIRIQGAAGSRRQNDESAAILFVNSNHCTVERVTIEGSASAGVLMHGSYDMRVMNNDIRNTMADGVHAVAGSHDILIANNTAFNTGDDSFAAVAYAKDPQTSDITIRDNTSTNSRARGAACIGAKNCIITGNHVVNPRAHGIVVAYEQSYNTHHPSGATVEGNTVEGVSSPGMNSILVDSASDINLGPNRVGSGNSVFIHDSKGVRVTGLDVKDAKGPGILIRESRDVTLRHNHVARSSGSGIVLDRVTGGDVSNNTLEDVNATGDPQSGDIDVIKSPSLTGDGNVSSHVTTPPRSMRVRLQESEGSNLHANTK